MIVWHSVVGSRRLAIAYFTTKFPRKWRVNSAASAREMNSTTTTRSSRLPVEVSRCVQPRSRNHRRTSSMRPTICAEAILISTVGMSVSACTGTYYLRFGWAAMPSPVREARARSSGKAVPTDRAQVAATQERRARGTLEPDSPQRRPRTEACKALWRADRCLGHLAERTRARRRSVGDRRHILHRLR